MRIEEHQAAITDFDRAIALDPRSALAYAYRGHAHARLGQLQAAVTDYERFLELEPQHERAGTIRAEVARLRALVAGQR